MLPMPIYLLYTQMQQVSIQFYRFIIRIDDKSSAKETPIREQVFCRFKYLLGICTRNILVLKLILQFQMPVNGIDS